MSKKSFYRAAEEMIRKQAANYHPDLGGKLTEQGATGHYREYFMFVLEQCLDALDSCRKRKQYVRFLLGLPCSTWGGAEAVLYAFTSCMELRKGDLRRDLVSVLGR